MRRRWWLVLLWVAVGMAVAFGVGAFRGSTSAGESIHFSINFPAEGKEAGGPGPMAKLGFVAADVGKAGFLKALVQPGVLNLSSHWVRNVGDRPLRIRLDIEGLDLPVRWDSLDKAWDPATRTIDRYLDPDETVTVDWFITLPDRLPADSPIVGKGQIVIFDADTGQRLSSLPVSIINSDNAMMGAVEGQSERPPSTSGGAQGAGSEADSAPGTEQTRPDESDGAASGGACCAP